MSTLFDERMRQGNAALNRGDFKEAAVYFALASETKPGSSEAEQLLGVCLRMMKWLDEADVVFDKAYAFARTDLQRAKVLRDWSMVAVLRRNYDLAQDYLSQSLTILMPRSTLEGVQLTVVADQAAETINEYYATMSFIGDLYRLTDYRVAAIDSLQKAYRNLKGADPYELNCLMRLLAALPWPSRILHAPKACQLAVQAKNGKRLAQIVVLLVSVRLHDRLLYK